MHGEEQKYIQEAFDTNWFSPLGPNVDAFEREIAAYAGASASAALSSGTAALHLSVILAGVREDDIVFIPSLTFAASVNPVRYEKAVPILLILNAISGIWTRQRFGGLLRNIRIRRRLWQCICTGNRRK